MNNPTNLTREQNLRNWSQIISECQSAKARGTKVRDWLEAHNISHDTYYYWYAEVRNSLINGAGTSQDIVPVSQNIISEVSTSEVIETTINYPGTTTASSSCIRITMNDVTIEINDLVNPDTLTNVIKAVRYA